MNRTIGGAGRALRGEMTVPGDKSISHRAVMLGALSEGTTHVQGFLNGADCLSTIGCFRKMGIDIRLSDDETELWIEGRGLHGLRAPGEMLDCGNSGTTTRLLSGILAAQDFTAELTGDASIQKRPMGRVIRPLTEMGARISSLRGNDCAPLHIEGSRLHGVRYASPVASAQVKSAILFAGLYADTSTTVHEPALSRDHSERMLRALGAEVETKILPDGSAEITVLPAAKLTAPGETLLVPGDISSAAYFISAAMLVPGSELLIRNVGVNPTRDGILEVYRSMGADITLLNTRLSGSEPVADLLVKHAPLKGTVIGGAVIPRLIDELPMIAAVAAAAEGETVIRDAAELKVKESNRIRVMTEGLTALGIDCRETEDGMVIQGQGTGLTLKHAEIDSHKDHRIAMTFAVLGLLQKEGELTIRDADCIDISYPAFFEDLEKIC